METTAQVRSKSLEGEHAAPHVTEEDVDAFLALAAAGAVPAAKMPNCGAVQNNISLRHDTRTTLTC